LKFFDIEPFDSKPTNSDHWSPTLGT